MEEDTKCCSPIPLNKELKVFSKTFIIFNAIISILSIASCAISVHYLGKTNVTNFLPVDTISLLISIIILCFIIIVVGWVAAVNNTALGWIIYHVCMVVLLLILFIVAIATSNSDSLVETVKDTWVYSDIDTRAELQSDLQCCGYANSSDNPALPCPNNIDVGCKSKITNLFADIRWICSTALFLLFIFCLFIEMSGCAMCVHPDTISMEEQQRDDIINISEIEDDTNFRNPFLI